MLQELKRLGREKNNVTAIAEAMSSTAAIAEVEASSPSDAVIEDTSHLLLDSVVDPTAEPLFAYQWYLHDDGSYTNGPGGIDLNVVDVWADYTGAGVTIGIWDDGVEYDHPDLAPNYDPSLHILLDDGTIHDPYPQSIDSEHGTAVAGIIAAAANGEGVVGVAYGASIAGVDIFYDPALGDDSDYDTYTQRLRDFDVTNHSWGWTYPYDSDLLSKDPFWTRFFDGIRDSVIHGRDGLGTINVTSAGNSRGALRTTNDSGFTSMPETIAVAAVHPNGLITDYSTPGASVLISAPSGGYTNRAGPWIWTTDRTGDAGYSDGSNQSAVGNDDSDYTAKFNGTSASAPMVSGIVALMLEANPLLGWRDVQDILALSARHVGTPIGEGLFGLESDAWTVNAASHWNGGGMHFSNDYGFGLVDALAAVRLAETWTKQQTSANWRIETAATWEGSLVIPDLDPAGTSVGLLVDSDIDLEMVSVTLSLTDNVFPDDSVFQQLRIVLTSPDGTESVLSTPNVRHNFLTPSEFIFYSHAFRGEDAEGVWTVQLADTLFAGYEDTLTGVEIQLLGDDPEGLQHFYFTNEFSEVADGAFGHKTVVGNGRPSEVNAAAVSSDTVIDVAGRKGIIDGVEVSGFRGVRDVFTGDGDDIIVAGNGPARLSGGRGDDEITGRNGSDIIVDGSGEDQLRGGRGPDQFVLVRDFDIDRIWDFDARIDSLVFEGNFGFADLAFDVVDDGWIEIDAMGDLLLLRGEGTRPLEIARFSEKSFEFVADVDLLMA